MNQIAFCADRIFKLCLRNIGQIFPSVFGKAGFINSLFCEKPCKPDRNGAAAFYFHKPLLRRKERRAIARAVQTKICPARQNVAVKGNAKRRIGFPEECSPVIADVSCRLVCPRALANRSPIRLRFARLWARPNPARFGLAEKPAPHDASDDTALCNDAADFFLDFQKDPILRTRRGSIAAQPQLFFIIRMIDGMPNDGTRVGVKVKIVDGIFPLFFFAIGIQLQKFRYCGRSWATWFSPRRNFFSNR